MKEGGGREGGGEKDVRDRRNEESEGENEKG